jgi:hypothetical protein
MPLERSPGVNYVNALPVRHRQITIFKQGEDDDSSKENTATTGGAARGKRAERRRAARARRGAGARNRAAVFSQNLPRELKKLGVMVGGTVVILGVLTVFLG